MALRNWRCKSANQVPHFRTHSCSTFLCYQTGERIIVLKAIHFVVFGVSVSITMLMVSYLFDHFTSSKMYCELLL